MTSSLLSSLKKGNHESNDLQRPISRREDENHFQVVQKIGLKSFVDKYRLERMERNGLNATKKKKF